MDLTACEWGKGIILYCCLALSLTEHKLDETQRSPEIHLYLFPGT